MKFLVTNTAREIGIENPVVCLYRNVCVKKKATEYDPLVAHLMERIGEIRERMAPTKEVQGFHTLYASLGSKVVPAGENLLKNCMQKKKFPRYNNLVDAYNIVALENVACLGVHDAEDFMKSGLLIFRRAHGNEEIIPSFKENKYTIPKGDLTYGISTEKGFDPFAWLGQKDVDSGKYQLTDKTTNILLTAIGHAQTSQEHNSRLCHQTFEMLKMTCPDVSMEMILPEFIDDVQK